jgi:hypothetical protein
MKKRYALKTKDCYGKKGKVLTFQAMIFANATLILVQRDVQQMQ